MLHSATISSNQRSLEGPSGSVPWPVYEPDLAVGGTPFRACLPYAEAGKILGGISEDAIRSLVDRGVLDRPEWSRTEVRVAVVSTVSVYRAAGWPIRPLDVHEAVKATVAELGEGGAA